MPCVQPSHRVTPMGHMRRLVEFPTGAAEVDMMVLPAYCRAICHPGPTQRACIAATFFLEFSQWLDWPSSCPNGNTHPLQRAILA